MRVRCGWYHAEVESVVLDGVENDGMDDGHISEKASSGRQFHVGRAPILMSQHEIHAGSVPFPESGGGFAHGFAHCQGRRPYMEDEVMVDIPLADGVRMFAVFDGHAGRKAIERIVEWVPEELRAALSKCTDADEWPRLTPEAITAAMLNVDTKLLAASEAEENWDDGATALLAITLDGEPRNAVQLVQLGDGQAALGGAMGVEEAAHVKVADRRHVVEALPSDVVHHLRALPQEAGVINARLHPLSRRAVTDVGIGSGQQQYCGRTTARLEISEQASTCLVSHKEGKMARRGVVLQRPRSARRTSCS